MTHTHVLEPGDHLGAIAAKYGFVHASGLWEHEGNAALRALRGSPDLLLVGDEIHIPDVPAAGVEVDVDQRVVFVARRNVDRVRIRLAGLGPLIAVRGPVPYELKIGSVVTRGEVHDEAQTIEAPLLPTETRATLTLMGGRVYEFAVGGLGPASTPKGAYARLVNLGFARSGPPPTAGLEGAGEQAADPLAQSVAAFQASVGLPRTGTLDEATVAALDQRYGQ